MGKITKETAQLIIDQYCQGSSTYELADKYELWQTTICNLISGRCWSECERPDNIKDLIKSRHEKGQFKKDYNQELHESYPPLTEKQKDIVVGSLLGDGYLTKTKPNHPSSSFTKKQCKKQKEYVEWHYKELVPFSRPVTEIFSKDKMIFNKKTKTIEHQKIDNRLTGYNIRTCQHPIFTELRQRWYPKGKKIVPKDLQLNPLIIAIWFCDDGCNNHVQREAIIATQSFTMGEASRLCRLLSEFNINPKIKIKVSPKTGIEQPILKMNSISYDNLIDLIKPFVVWDCMRYKINWRPAIRQWEYSSELSEEDVLKIYDMGGKYTQRKIAEMFGVHHNTISAILTGKSWDHLTKYNNYKYKLRAT